MKLVFWFPLVGQVFKSCLDFPFYSLVMAQVEDIVVGDYPLARDLVDFNRLNLQHYLYKDIFGYLIHPKIPRSQKSLKIADVATGTGVWLLDVSSQLDASAELVGFDTDITQVGPREWLPDNMSLREWDVFTEPPDELVGTFHIVNLRLFCYVLEDDPTFVLRNVAKLLKPGGYLQWCEVDVSSMRIHTSSPDVPTVNLRALWDETIPKGTRMMPGWAKDLPRVFRDEGFVGVEADWRQGKNHTGIAMHFCNLPVHEMVVAKLRPGNPQKASEIHEVFQKAFAESRRGATYLLDRVVVIGQKPSTLN